MTQHSLGRAPRLLGAVVAALVFAAPAALEAAEGAGAAPSDSATAPPRPLRKGESAHLRAAVPRAPSARRDAEAEAPVPPELCESVGEEIGVFRAKDSTFDQRAAAAERLLELGPAVWPALRTVLAKLDGEPARWIALVIGKTNDSRALPGLAVKFDSPDPSVRAAVLQALADIGDPAALPIVQRALRDPEASVRRLGASALRHFPADAVAPLLSSVVAALFDADAEVRELAKDGLERLPLVDDKDGAADVVSLVSETLLAAPADTVDAGAELSAELAHDRVRDLLLAAVRDENRTSRDGAVRALAAFRGDDVRRALETCVADHDEAVSSAAAAALERRGDERSVRPLIGALVTSRGANRTRIVAALRQLTGESLGSEPEPWQAWWLDHAAALDN